MEFEELPKEDDEGDDIDCQCEDESDYMDIKIEEGYYQQKDEEEDQQCEDTEEQQIFANNDPDVNNEETKQIVIQNVQAQDDMDNLDGTQSEQQFEELDDFPYFD